MRLYGKNPVIERLRTNPQSIKKIYIESGTSKASMFTKKANQAKISIFTISASKMMKIARNKNTQGVLADIFDFEFTEYNEMMANALKNKRTPIFLDEVTDPQNLGAIIRSLACLGKFCLVLPTHNTVTITETVLRVASGGENHVPVARVPNLRNAIRYAQKEGFWVMGAVVDAEDSITDIKLQWPVALAVGSEQKGIREVIAQQIDAKVRINMAGSTLSFNVGHATSIICYEISKQKRK